MIFASYRMTKLEWKRGDYPSLRSVYSPVKVYHQTMFAVYGYIIVSTALACLGGVGWQEARTWYITALICTGLYIVCVVGDVVIDLMGKFPGRARFAIVDDWSPLWVTLAERRHSP